MHFPHTHNTNSTSVLTKAKVLQVYSVRKKKRDLRERFMQPRKSQQQVFVCVISDHTSMPYSFSSPYFLLKLCMHLALLFCPCMSLVHINHLSFAKSRGCSSANPCSWSTTGHSLRRFGLISDHIFVKPGPAPTHYIRASPIGVVSV